MTGQINVTDLRRSYISEYGDPSVAVNIDKLTLPLGGVVAIVGGSGSGKTTLLNLLGALEPSDQSAELNTSIELTLPDSDQTHLFVKNGIGHRKVFPYEKVSYIFQQGYLLNQGSIALNLGITRRAAGYKADVSSLESLLRRAQLQKDGEKAGNKKLSDRAITLSGGQQQRINIARALGREPQIIFADELTSSLDPIKAADVMSELKQWVWQGNFSDGAERSELSRTLIWVTHDYHLASRYADAILVMSEGRLATGLAQPIECAHLRVPLHDSQILSWVREGHVPDSVGSEHTETSKSVHDGNPLSYHHLAIPSLQPLGAFSAAVSNMYDGIKLSLMEAYKPFNNKNLKGAKNTALSGALRTLIFGFSHWVRALQLAAVLSLIMLVTYGQSEVIDYFDAELNDPSLRHVVVQQNTLELQRSIIDDDSLLQLSTDIALLDPLFSEENRGQVEGEHGSYRLPLAAFGRSTESVDIYPKGLNRIKNPGYIAEVTMGVFDSSEPVYSSLNVEVFDADGSSCLTSEIAAPSSLIPYADERVVFVTQAYSNRFKEMNGMDLCEYPYFDVWDAGEPKTFRVVGMVNKAPADGFENFEVLIQRDVWQTWVAEIGKPTINTFSRAAVYFNQNNNSGVIDQLRARAFAYDREIIDKFERLLGTAAKLRNTFLVITWLSLAVAATVAAGLIWGYLAQNAQAIAVLRAHAAWRWPFLAAIPFQLILTFVYASIYIAFAIIVWNVLIIYTPLASTIYAVTSGGWLAGQISLDMLAPTMPWLAGSFVVMLLVGWCCLGIWRLTRKELAHELKDAY